MTNGARKIVIEGCPTATGNAFKVIGESKGKHLKEVKVVCRVGRQEWRFAIRDNKNHIAFTKRYDEVDHLGRVGRFHKCPQRDLQLI